MSTAWLTRDRAGPSLTRLSGRAALAAPNLALAGISAVAAVLRFDGLGAMRVNPYYDAAVRSMGTSWHAFLVGAFNPNASVAVDKPPLDLWLQVAGTKLFGFTPFALHLPEALASTAAVLLLYDLVRRGFGRTAGLLAAAALAVLPAAVVTARSDTMDGLMAALLVLAAWLVVRSLELRRARELYLAGAVVGLAFETKLFEALVPLPALVLLFMAGSCEAVRVRIRRLAGAGAAMTAAGLAWPLLFAVTPARARPFPLGSSGGSIWSTIFVYNGIGRLQGSSIHAGADRLSPAGPGRLFAGGPLHLDTLVGVPLAAALGLGAAAILLGLVRRRSLGRIPFALALSMCVWLVLGAVLLSFMAHAPVRYLEVLAPALAAVFGIALALLARAGAGRRFGPLLAALAASALLAAPASHALTAVRHRSSDAGALGVMAPRTVSALSHYLARRQTGARYEFATLQAHLAAPLIAADPRPVFVIAGTPWHPLVSQARLADAVRAGDVRYVLMSDHPRSAPLHPSAHARTRRGRMAAWIRSHGVDVTRQAGVAGYGLLYRLTPATVGR